MADVDIQTDVYEEFRAIAKTEAGTSIRRLVNMVLRCWIDMDPVDRTVWLYGEAVTNHRTVATVAGPRPKKVT